MVYDAATQQVVLFGGSGDGPALNDTWTWDGTNWTLQTPPESPPARDGLGMAYDTTAQKVVLFGGCTRFCVQFLGDTWTWDGTNWTEEHPASSPPSEHQMGMTYDDARSWVALFGGSNPSGLLDDTWTWDGATWTKQTPASSPPARDYIAVDMAFDAARSQVVLFGGSGASGLLNDTWTWDGATWTQQTPVYSPPPGYGIPMAYDATGHEIVLYGPPYFTDTWTWDGTTWLL
jgi:Galactose oxidase, central domain